MSSVCVISTRLSGSDRTTSGLDVYVVEQLQLECPEADLSDWQRVVDAQLAPKQEVKIAFVGKYLELLDAYKSLIEAITHAGIQTETKIHIDY